MGKTRRIPVVRNRIVVQPQKKRSGLRRLLLLGLLSALMIFYVWLNVETAECLHEIEQLQENLQVSQQENERLRAEVAKLSSFARINEIARTKLGLVFVENEKVIEVPQK